MKWENGGTPTVLLRIEGFALEPGWPRIQSFWHKIFDIQRSNVKEVKADVPQNTKDNSLNFQFLSIYKKE